MWYIFALLSGFLSAIVAIIIKLYLKHINPLFVTFSFALITFIALILTDLFTKKINCNLVTCIPMKDWIALICAAIANTLAFSCYVGAFKCGKASGVVAIDRLGILFVVIMSIFFLQEAFSFKAFVGAILMILGAILLSL